MKKCILSIAVMITITWFWLLPSFSAQYPGGIVPDQGKVKQPIDDLNAAQAKEKISKAEAQRLGRDTARRFYNGQITSAEVDQKYQEMLRQGRQRDYMRGYNKWKGQNVPAEEKKKKEPAETEDTSGEE